MFTVIMEISVAWLVDQSVGIVSTEKCDFKGGCREGNDHVPFACVGNKHLR